MRIKTKGNFSRYNLIYVETSFPYQVFTHKHPMLWCLSLFVAAVRRHEMRHPPNNDQRQEGPVSEEAGYARLVQHRTKGEDHC